MSRCKEKSHTSCQAKIIYSKIVCVQPSLFQEIQEIKMAFKNQKLIFCLRVRLYVQRKTIQLFKLQSKKEPDSQCRNRWDFVRKQSIHKKDHSNPGITECFEKHISVSQGINLSKDSLMKMYPGLVARTGRIKSQASYVTLCLPIPYTWMKC